MIKVVLSFLLALTAPCFNAFAQFDKFTWKIVTTTGTYTPREECDFVAVDNKFYLLGGRGVNEVNIFDPKKKHMDERSKATC